MLTEFIRLQRARGGHVQIRTSAQKIRGAYVLEWTRGMKR